MDAGLTYSKQSSFLIHGLTGDSTVKDFRKSKMSLTTRLANDPTGDVLYQYVLDLDPS